MPEQESEFISSFFTHLSFFHVQAELVLSLLVHYRLFYKRHYRISLVSGSNFCRKPFVLFFPLIFSLAAILYYSALIKTGPFLYYSHFCSEFTLAHAHFLKWVFNQHREMSCRSFVMQGIVIACVGFLCFCCNASEDNLGRDRWPRTPYGIYEVLNCKSKCHRMMYIFFFLFLFSLFQFFFICGILTTKNEIFILKYCKDNQAYWRALHNVI